MKMFANGKMFLLCLLMISLAIGGCLPSNRITDSQLIGTWKAIEFFGNAVEPNSGRQFIDVFNADHSCKISWLSGELKGETIGTWRLVNEKNSAKLHRSTKDGTEIYNVEINEGVLTLTRVDVSEGTATFKSVWNRVTK